MSNKLEKTIMCIGDIHAPYEHKQAWDFLDAVRRKFKPTRVVQIGDEIDAHSLSFHPKDPDLNSPKAELSEARDRLKPLMQMFPRMDVIESNHGSLVMRKALDAGLPREVIKSYREILKAPKGWVWHFDLIIDTALGPIYFHHGKSAAPGKLSQSQSMNAVQGHYHSKFYIYYWASPAGLFWDMNIGCLADDKSLAMGYGKNNLPRPILGAAVIEKGIPQTIPMVLNSKGKWVGKL